MAKALGGFFDFSQSGRGRGGFTATWYGADALQETLDGIAKDLYAFDDKGNFLPAKLAANREMREAAKGIAKDVLIPQMKLTARSSPVKIARAMAETARPKSDRLIAVQVGGVNPPLRGFKRGVGVKRAKGRTGGAGGRDASSRTYRTTLAWGSEFGPKGGRRQPSRGNNIPSGPVNHYKVPRNERGYWVIPAVENAQSRAVDLWEAALEKIVDKYIRFRPGGERG